MGISAAASDRLAASEAGVGPRSAATADQAASGREDRPLPWWNDPEVQRELALAPDKIKRINDLFARRSQEVRTLFRQLERERAALDTMTRERVVDESTYSLQVMSVENVRARLNEARLVMLYRFYRELSPEQYQKLQAIQDRDRNSPERASSTDR